MTKGVITAACALVTSLAIAAAAPQEGRDLIRRASEDLKVIDVRRLSSSDRRDYDLATAMIRAAREAAGRADSQLVAERAATQVAHLIEGVLAIDVEARFAERYRTEGKVDELLDAAEQRSAEDLDRLGNLAVRHRARLGQRTSAFASFTPALLAADVLLHTSVSFRNPDGMAHLRYAHRVLASLDDTSLPNGFRAGWYLAALGYVEGEFELLDAATLADEAATRFPSNAEVLVAAGVFDEALALQSVKLPAIDARLLWGKASEEIMGLPKEGSNQRKVAALWERKRSSLRAAERLYRLALAVDSSCAEGHLRLGRVLTLSGQVEEALTELHVARIGGDERIRYLASLFAGDVHERQGRWSEAIQEYSHATDLCPSCFSARVALSYAERRGGDIQRGSEALNAALVGGLPERADDPWWYYPLGGFLSRDGRVETLRRSLSVSAR